MNVNRVPACGKIHHFNMDAEFAGDCRAKDSRANGST